MSYNCDECGHDKKMCECVEPDDYTYGYSAIKNQSQDGCSANMSNSPWQSQKGGSHYKTMQIQPFEYSMANKLDPMQHTAIKYVTRFRDKGGVEDLKKAIHTIELLIEWEERNA